MKKTLFVCVLAAGCGTVHAVTTMENPARTSDKIVSTQTEEIGLVKENHQYEATIASWSPQSIGVRLKLTDVDRCSQLDSYNFTLVDDHGARSSLHVNGTPAQSTRPGHQGMTLKESLIEGTFDAAIGADSKFLVIEQRPAWGYDCPAIDFRWDLK